MKKNLLLLFTILCSLTLNAQVSTGRINEVKLGMKKSELDKLTGKKIRLVEDENSYNYEKSIFDYKGVVYMVTFRDNYDDYGNKLREPVITLIESNDKSLKTLSGVSIGSSVETLLEKYKNYNISLIDSWDSYGNRTKIERDFIIHDYENNNKLIFNLYNGKVTKFCVEENSGVY